MSDAEPGIRCFVAVDIPGDVGEMLADIQAAFRKRYGAVPASWVRLSSVHLTLRFLGTVPPDRLSVIRKNLAFIRSHRPFEISLEQVGFFPDADKARILWCGYKRSAELSVLQANIEAAVVSGGLAPEPKPFIPHVTLARFKVVPRGAATSLHEIAREKKPSAIHSVREIVLYRSTLRPHGAEYSVIESYSLGGGS